MLAYGGNLMDLKMGGRLDSGWRLLAHGFLEHTPLAFPLFA
jgi:hypothetical protein